MQKMRISNQQARYYLLAHQGLTNPLTFTGKNGILEFINRVGCIQFDPLNIVGHNHELVLQSRIAQFHPQMLADLLYQERALLDGWDKNMSIYAASDWPNFYRNRKNFRGYFIGRSPQIQSVEAQVRKFIDDTGPIDSSALDLNQKVDWPWGPTRLSRAVLECMYFSGELIIHHKTRTRKFYDLAYKYLSSELLHLPDPNGPEDQYHDWHILRRLGSVGLMWNKPGDAWLGIPALHTPQRNAAFNRLLARESILPIEVEGIPNDLYIRQTDLPLLQTIVNNLPASDHTAVIAPLDNLIWDRKLTQSIFNFEYRWEVYKPVELRTYGYYVLPILSGDRFVARFEPGFDKKKKAFRIKHWWWEKNVHPDDLLIANIKNCLVDFCLFLGAKTFEWDPGVSDQEQLSLPL